MARIAGIDLPRTKRVEIGLTYIYGIGRVRSNTILKDEGVSPDIEVIDTPHLVAQGRDPSLEKAVEVLLAELAKNPIKPISAPPAPSDFGKPGEPLN